MGIWKISLVFWIENPAIRWAYIPKVVAWRFKFCNAEPTSWNACLLGFWFFWSFATAISRRDAFFAHVWLLGTNVDKMRLWDLLWLSPAMKRQGCSFEAEGAYLAASTNDQKSFIKTFFEESNALGLHLVANKSWIGWFIADISQGLYGYKIECVFFWNEQLGDQSLGFI